MIFDSRFINSGKSIWLLQNGIGSAPPDDDNRNAGDL